MFGRDYITQYKPIKADGGKVIAISFVGLDFTEGLKIFQERIGQIKIGDAGFVFIIDGAEGKNKGLALLHAQRQGQNMLDVKDGGGRTFIREMLDRKSGTTRYVFDGADRPAAQQREKIVAFDYFGPWNWLIASGAYAEEFAQELRPCATMPWGRPC